MRSKGAILKRLPNKQMYSSMNKSKYRYLLADLDNTLLDFSSSERISLSRVLTVFGVEPDDRILDAYSSFNDSLWKKLEKGLLTRDQLIATRFVEFFREYGINADGTKAAPMYEKNLSESVVFIDGAIELLRRCRGEISVYIISNGTARVQLPRLAASGIDVMTDGYFISELVGHTKPEPAFFDAVAEGIPGFDRSSALILGDSLTADISGGVSYGIDTCLFDPHGKYDASSQIKPDMRISELSELCDILKI